MTDARGLTLGGIRGRRLPGVATGPGGQITPIYSVDACDPEVTHYLIGALDEALALLDEARSAVDPGLRARIDGFKSRV